MGSQRLLGLSVTNELQAESLWQTRMTRGEHFNEAQSRRLLTSSNHIDKLLVDVEQILSSASADGFPKYKNPVSPVQAGVIRDYIKRIRQQILRVLSDLEIPLPEAQFDSIHSIRVVLQFVEIALEEIAPSKLHGYGTVPESLIPHLAGGLQEIKGMVRQIDSYLVQTAHADLSSRIFQLADASQSTALLKLSTEIIERRHLIEFRAPLSQLVEKLESPAYEIAFFGRVSAGKSSLLNRIIGIDLLPTGVTPVTAVPTRVKNGANPSLSIWTADGRVRRESIERLAEFVTESGNPGNTKRVIRLLVEVPLAILPGEAVLVDTPGLGSLALEGAIETLAYLPRCDVGVVLIDASSSIHQDDLATMDALRSASIEPIAVLSKIDLLQAADQDRLLDYTRKQIRRQLGVDIPVSVLSSHPEYDELLSQWIRAEIEPRVANARQLALEANYRKIRRLCGQVLHALDTMSSHAPQKDGTGMLQKRRTAEEQLRTAASRIEPTRADCFQVTDRMRNSAETLIAIVVETMVAGGNDHDMSKQPDRRIEQTINRVAQKEAESVASYVQLLARNLQSASAQAAEILLGYEFDRTSLEILVKDLPVPSFTSTELVSLAKPKFLLPKALASRMIEHRLAVNLLSPLQNFCSYYGRDLETWVRITIDGLAKEFETRADVYRAHLQRLAPETDSAERGDNDLAAQDASALRKSLRTDEEDRSVSAKSVHDEESKPHANKA